LATTRFIAYFNAGVDIRDPYAPRKVANTGLHIVRLTGDAAKIIGNYSLVLLAESPGDGETRIVVNIRR
jgi:hypothetical protein